MNLQSDEVCAVLLSVFPFDKLCSSVHSEQVVRGRPHGRQIFFPHRACCPHRKRSTGFEYVPPGALNVIILIDLCLPDVLQKRPSTPTMKSYIISHMETETHSFEYVRSVLSILERQAMTEISRLGGNPQLEAIVSLLSVPPAGPQS
jgi:hypothetical protein